MSNTSDQTTKQNDKTRLIVGEVGIDTETGIVGKGHSYDNGKTFVVDDTIYGRVYHADDHGKIWKGIQDQVAKVVDPAKSAADSAVSAADAAVASAQVTSDAVTAIASATAEAKQGANEAMSRAKSAWDVATGAKSAVTDFDPLLKSAQSDAGKALTQIADTASALSDARTSFGSDVADAKELANTAQTTADNAVAVASDARSNATVAIQTASGASLTAINAQGDATIAKQTASEATVQASNAESDFAQLSIRANKIEANVADNSGAIASVQQTANGLTATVADIKANGGGVNLLTGTSGDLQTKQFTNSWNSGPQATNGNYQIKLVKGQTYTYRAWLDNTNGPDTASTNVWLTPIGGTSYSYGNGTPIAKGETGYSTLSITPPEDVYASFIPVAYNAPETFLAGWKEEMLEEGTVAHTWSPAPDDLQDQFTQIKQSINGVTTTINDPKTGLNATYQTAQGNASTISNVKGDVTQLQATANGLTSRVGSLESKTDTQQTAIDQNKAAIALKADQTVVDTLKGTVNQNTATLNTQASQIQAKVSASDVSGMLTGYATQSYTQSLVTQTADNWNLNLTKLQTDVNAIKTTGGGVNLLTGTSGDLQTKQFTNSWNSGPQATNGNYKIKLVKGQTYTYRVWLDNTNGPDTASTNVWLTPIGGTSYSYGNGTPIAKGETGYSTLSITPPEDVYASFVPVAYNTPETFLAKWKEEMLEEGTVAHTWSPAPSDMATVTSVTNLSATVDGIQAQVYNSDGSSKITQLSNVIQTKVGTDDFNNLKQAVGLQTLDSADINNMKTNGHYFVHNLANNPIGGWVYVDVTGDGNIRIRQDVYQDNGTKHKYRRWVDTNWTDWEEGATYTEINQLQDAINLRVTKGDLISQINLQAGTSLIQSDKLVLDANTTVFTGDAFIPDAAISEINTDKLYFSDSNGNKSFMSTNLGALDPMAPANSLSIRYNTGYEVTTSDRGVFFMMGQNYTRYAVRSKYSDKFSGIWASDTEAFFIEEGQGLHLWAPGEDQSAWALYNSNNVGIRASLANTNAIDVGKVDDGYAYNTKMDTSPTAIAFYVNGWEWVAGYVEAMGHSTHSTLSSKTRIEEADPDHMLDLVNNTDLTTFAYKSELADGTDHRHIGPIIDDINDVAQYQIPSEFVTPTKTARDDGNIVGALIGAVQALTKRIKTLEEKTK